MMCVTSFLLVVLIILPPAGKVNSLGESFILYLQTGQKRMISFTKCSKSGNNLRGGHPPYCQWAGSGSVSLLSGQVSASPLSSRM